ncbi:MAG: ABC transporter ATP-binding protein [Thermoguttaceae bacterium]
MSIIRTEQLTRSYGRRIGVDAINLEIGAGEVFGFLGPNGSGKTTTIRLLMGFLRPDTGRASIFDLDCWRQSALVKRDVGYLPGDLRLYPWLTGKTALHIFGKIRGVDLNDNGSELAERFRLEMDVRVEKMSRGMRQKLGIILAMAHKPRLLVLDEPTSGLDPLMQQELARSIREFAAAGNTVFFSSHTLSEVENLCNRVAIVREGRIIADERLEMLRSRARRTVELVFVDKEAAQRAELPSYLQLVHRDGCRCQCELDGPTPPLVHWADGEPLADISIGPPDLRSMFQKFYQPPREPS